MDLFNRIEKLADGRFDVVVVKDFLEKFKQLSDNEKIVDSILQISTDAGEELEVGFFTTTRIVDITLSKGKVYSCFFPFSNIKNLNFFDAGNKWTLSIIGDKKFDYNVVKPGQVDPLKKYETSLRNHMTFMDLILLK